MILYRTSERLIIYSTASSDFMLFAAMAVALPVQWKEEATMLCEGLLRRCFKPMPLVACYEGRGKGSAVPAKLESRVGLFFACILNVVNLITSVCGLLSLSFL